MKTKGIFQIGDKVNFHKRMHNWFGPWDKEIIPCVVKHVRKFAPAVYRYDVEPTVECGIEPPFTSVFFNLESHCLSHIETETHPNLIRCNYEVQNR